MAEAFAALGIAANIAQFTDYARQLISGGKEIYNSLDGARDEHKALKVIIDDIKNLDHDCQPVIAKSSPQSSSADEIAFRKLAAECEPLADKLLAILNDLEVPNNARFRGLQTVRQTIRGAARRRDIQELLRRITDIDMRLRYRVTRVLEERHFSSITSAIKTLTQESERLKMNTEQTLELSKLDLLHTVKNPLMAQQNDFDNLPTKLSSFIKEGQKLAQQQAILQTLLFEQMEQREENIKDAHKATLDWMFQKNGAKFMEWLETEEGIYWVRGKAGSGKSTLMKYVCNHETTLEALGTWADGVPLFTASFFFWNAGFPMQKSQVGLLQSLLYQVLRACPALITEVCPPKAPREPWKRKELFEALTKVSSQTTLPAKFCFFVDGLDEYEGEDEDIITLLQELASSPSVKICVSSRPWNVFVDAFDDSEWKLVLENLTREDMRKYVQTQLVQNDAFSRATLHDPRCQTLISQIAKKAQGVWLWVYLVVRDLLRDLRGAEEYPLLQRRLDSFPAELEKYFEDILDRIDKIHQEETARIFLVAVTAIQPFPLISLHYLSMEAADTDYAIHMTLSRLSKRKSFPIKHKWRKLLNSRCRDLLETDEIIIERAIVSGTSVLDGKVTFLHRTVRDFLRINYYDELRRRAGDGFDARAALCKTILCLAKASFDPVTVSDTTCDDQPGPNFHLVDEMLVYARDYERIRARSLANLLDELDRVNIIMNKEQPFHWTNLRFSSNKGQDHCTFLALAIQAGLRLYVNEKLEANKALVFQKQGRPLLDYACRPERLPATLSRQEDIPDPPMIRLLLEHGSNPNQSMGPYETVWSRFISYTRPKHPESLKASWYEAAELMIDHGGGMLSSKDFPLVLGSDRMPDRIRGEYELGKIFGREKTERLVLRREEYQRNHPKPSIFRRFFGWT
ncbi:hypothetical protein L207DRAFT_553693 [Hyaloscypha variabilis F]|uniref:Uncharacterized protein n=1 Tax=Hyaloscypha variabilis (strain UAMH 11265 / GT02V1 / F) TaxID=1149755 RepID=A0A2J6RW42_HYAVF|nr:hypothetical protein L207DRAFT_553693 [Hyaloscypha variabilis F]